MQQIGVGSFGYVKKESLDLKQNGIKSQYAVKYIQTNKLNTINDINVGRECEICEKILEFQEKNDQQVQDLKGLKNIIRIYDVKIDEDDNENDIYKIVMEYCPKSIQQYIQQCRDEKTIIPETKAKIWIKQIFEALIFLKNMEKNENNNSSKTNQGISHRDIKEDNIMLDFKEQIKLIDFTLAKEVDEEDTNTTMLGGSNLYISYERLLVRDNQKVEYNPFKSDIWSVGVLLYLMIFQKYPFKSQAKYSLLGMIEEKLYNNDKIYSEKDGLLSIEDILPQDSSRNISDSLKNFFLQVFQKDAKRPDLDQILEHEWIKSIDVSTLQMVNEQFDLFQIKNSNLLKSSEFTKQNDQDMAFFQSMNQNNQAEQMLEIQNEIICWIQMKSLIQYLIKEFNNLSSKNEQELIGIIFKDNQQGQQAFNLFINSIYMYQLNIEKQLEVIFKDQEKSQQQLINSLQQQQNLQKMYFQLNNFQNLRQFYQDFILKEKNIKPLKVQINNNSNNVEYDINKFKKRIQMIIFQFLCKVQENTSIFEDLFQNLNNNLIIKILGYLSVFIQEKIDLKQLINILESIQLAQGDSSKTLKLMLSQLQNYKQEKK